MTVVRIVVVLVVEAGSGCVLLSQEIVELDVERCHRGQLLQHLSEQSLEMLLSRLLSRRQLLHRLR